MIIQSKDNKLIKYAKKLTDKKFSKLENKTLVESTKLINELIKKGLVECVFCTDKYLKFFENKGFKVYIINEQIVKYLSQTETSQQTFAIVNLPKSTFDFTTQSRFIVLDNIQDPTNYGAIIRSAVAFNYAIIDINCTYLYSGKVTRCSMGNNFKCNVLNMDYDTLKDFCYVNKIKLISCDMNGKDVKNSRPNSNKFAIIIGNEGNGVSKTLMDMSNEVVSIPMQNGVESLNASVTAGIVMYYFKD